MVQENFHLHVDRLCPALCSPSLLLLVSDSVTSICLSTNLLLDSKSNRSNNSCLLKFAAGSSKLAYLIQLSSSLPVSLSLSSIFLFFLLTNNSVNHQPRLVEECSQETLKDLPENANVCFCKLLKRCLGKHIEY